MRRTTLALLFGAALLVGTAPVAARQSQAPILIESSPQDGETVHEPPARVELTFSEPLDDSSTIEVRDECNGRMDAGATTVQLNEMWVAIEGSSSGLWVVSYSATGLGGTTGTTNGSITFTVHMGSSCDGSGGGGHGGHGGNSGGGGGGGHGGHDGSGGGGHSGGGHSGGGHSGGEHVGGTTAHASGAHTGDQHAAGPGGHGEHGRGNGKGRHADHHEEEGPNDAGPNEIPTRDLAAPEDLVPAPDGTTLLVALGAAILVGAAGGLLMRVGIRL